MLNWTRRATRCKRGASGQVVLMPGRMRGQFDTHQRHTDEIGDFFMLDQPHGIFGIPFRHHHQLTPDGKTLKHDWNRCSHVK